MEHRTWNIAGKGQALYAAIIRAIFSRACRLVRCSKEAEISVVLVGDKKMRDLNRKYRKKDKTTNVLAFPTYAPCSMRHAPCDLGDIFISLPEAKREAKKYGWTLKYAIARLALHGFLHLLGYDHEQEKEARVMEGLEQKILKKYVER